MKNRNGISLVELTINLSTASVLMLLAVSAVHNVMTIRARTTELTNHSRSVARLSLQLRRDVHSAEAAIMNAENELQLQLDNSQTVSYRIAPGAIIRKSSVADSSDSDDSSHERYALRESTLAELALSQDTRTVEVVVSRNTPSQAEPKITENKIRAVVGLWRADTTKEQP